MSELYNDYSAFKKLELQDEPIGVKFSFFRPENVEPLEQDAAMSLCEMLRMSQRENRAFYFSKDNKETCVGKILLGMEDMAPFAESGNIGQRLGVFNDARCNQHFYQFVPKLDRNVTNYVSFSPISKMTYEPDVLVVAAPPEKAEMVMRAMTYTTGEHYKSECTPVMGCAWLLLKPYKTQEVNFIVPALVHGPHGRELYPSDTLLIGIPYRWIPAIIKGLSEMPLHLEGHESREKYYAEFEGILKDLSEKAQNP